MCNPRKIFLLFVIVLCLAGRGFAATALGSIAITGAEQSSGSTWDTGTVTATINGVSVSYAYGQFSTPASVASALGALISCNCNMPVYAQANGATLTFYQRGSNTITSASITSASNNPSLFPASSFLVAGASGWSAPHITGLSLTQGPPSMGFVITGANFGYTPGSVTIGGIRATVVPNGWTPGAITVQVPVGAPTGDVIVSTSGLPSNGWRFTVDTPIGCK